MRRTLFVFPRDLLPAAWGSASARVAAQLGPRLAQEAERAGSPTTVPPGSRLRVPPWSRGSPTAASWRRRPCGRSCPSWPAGSTWPPARRTAATSRSRRGCWPSSGSRASSSAGHNARPLADLPAACGRSMSAWLGEPPSRWTRARRGTPSSWPALAAHLRPGHRGRPHLVARQHRRRRAPRAGRRRRGRGVARRRRDRLGAARRPRRRPRESEPWAALLPVLDPTVMGWKERDFFLGPHGPDALRPQRQRRHHRLVGRPGRRLLGAGRGRASYASACWRTSRRDGRAALDVEADAAHRLAGRWPTDRHGLLRRRR